MINGCYIGDYFGSPYQNKETPKTKDFELYRDDCRFTDETFLTLDVEDALSYKEVDFNKPKDAKAFIEMLTEFFKITVECATYVEFGERFREWANSHSNVGYGSIGNGAAGRTSPVGYFANSEKEAKKLSRMIAEITHNSKEGIKSAECITLCIYKILHGATKENIKDFVIKNYYEVLGILDYKDLLENYAFDETAEGSVPVAIYAFLIGNSFEDCIRTAITIGGDTDSIASICGALAEAYYRDEPETKKFINEFLKRISKKDEYFTDYHFLYDRNLEYEVIKRKASTKHLDE